MKMHARIMNRLRPEWFTLERPIEPRTEDPRILIADDHAGSRLGFRVALEVAGFNLVEAGDGERALEALRTASIDAVLLDLRMPGLDGMEVLRLMREESIDVPVVVITAHGSISGALRAMEMGALDFLSKPIEPSVLRETILKVLVRRGWAGGHSYRPAPNTLGGRAHRFADTLAVARRALEHNRLDLADYLLQQALDLDPESAEANALRGVLYENLGEHHAAYQSYKRALTQDLHHTIALAGMRRYCERFGLDLHNRAINPDTR